MVNRDPDIEVSGIPAPALLIEGVHFAGEQPFALERRLIALDTVPVPRADTFETEAPGSWLLHHVPWTDARHRIRAVSAGGRWPGSEARCPCGLPQVERWTWRTGRAVTFVRQTFPGIVTTWSRSSRRGMTKMGGTITPNRGLSPFAQFDRLAG